MKTSDIDNDVIAQLEEFVPSRQYHLTLFKPVVRLFVADHSSSSKQETKKGKKVLAYKFVITLQMILLILIEMMMQS